MKVAIFLKPNFHLTCLFWINLKLLLTRAMVLLLKIHSLESWDQEFVHRLHCFWWPQIFTPKIVFKHNQLEITISGNGHFHNYNPMKCNLNPITIHMNRKLFPNRILGVRSGTALELINMLDTFFWMEPLLNYPLMGLHVSRHHWAHCWDCPENFYFPFVKTAHNCLWNRVEENKFGPICLKGFPKFALLTPLPHKRCYKRKSKNKNKTISLRQFGSPFILWSLILKQFLFSNLEVNQRRTLYFGT